ncbi:efflux RND transporter periplasmic adaptor subunit [Lentilitoribacter sp. Alg239-R112]|uniref:efflux RND transporter periplasmic adaptor subunit n=1 Tax=Lentilitoribacter sp. Alg239-R112 TaxID=2305987 RepID=UPI0013A6FE08|nr:efflux RND transporter periplasmic adaptor subunit [Lentilitoribacter sp. Alg239-R112]
MNDKTDKIELPLVDNGLVKNDKADKSSPAAKPQRSFRKLLFIPVAMMLIVFGGIVGMYFQPPGLKAFFGVTGLAPGGGTSTPIAVALDKVTSQEEVAVLSEGDIFALGRLIPDGDVITIATPFGAGDARIAALNVDIGDKVQRGDTLAVLDNLTQLENAVETAKATLKVRTATLNQTKSKTEASLSEARATFSRAEVTYEAAKVDLERATSLLERGVTTRAKFDNAQARATETLLDVERARATLSRYDTENGVLQADIAVAEANLDAAYSDLTRAQSDLGKAYVKASADGTVLDIHVNPGERPPSTGILNLGNTEKMTVEVEVYQTLIGRVSLGDPVTISAKALPQELMGTVSAIGLEIGRQTITSDDPAANTDARVVDVIVALDDASSAIASRLTNLEVVARIDAGRDQ